MVQVMVQVWFLLSSGVAPVWSGRVPAWCMYGSHVFHAGFVYGSCSGLLACQVQVWFRSKTDSGRGLGRGLLVEFGCTAAVVVVVIAVVVAVVVVHYC